MGNQPAARPERMSVSTKPTSATRTEITAWPGPGALSGTVATVSTPGPPNSRTSTTRWPVPVCPMAATLKPQLLLRSIRHDADSARHAGADRRPAGRPQWRGRLGPALLWGAGAGLGPPDRGEPAPLPPRDAAPG